MYFLLGRLGNKIKLDSYLFQPILLILIGLKNLKGRVFMTLGICIYVYRSKFWKVCSTEGRDVVLKQEFWEIFKHFFWQMPALSKFAEISNFIIYVFDLRFCRLPFIQYCTFWSTVIQFCMETYLQFYKSRIIYLLDLRHILHITELNNFLIYASVFTQFFFSN